MAGGEDPKEFPDVSHKLSAPKKLSAFEKERQAAEEKKRREKAENEAALKEFEDSFADNGNNDDYDGFPRFPSAPTGPRGLGMGYGGPPGRFGGPPRSGPGSLGPIPGPQPPNLKRKRALDEMRELQEAKRDQDDFTAEYLGRRDRQGEDAARERDEEEQVDIAPRPTVQLSSLPPSTTEEDVKRLLRGHLQVHSVHLQPPVGPASAGRRSMTAIAQLSSETSTSEIDTTVSALKDKYLGCGYCLTISRHLSSTSLHTSMPIAVSTPLAEPFGGQKIDRDQHERFSLRNAPPPSQFAPPGSYDARPQAVAPANAIVDVQPPSDTSTLRAVHTLADRLLSEPDPGRALQLEALLMALPEIQNDERFSFLYDSRSPAGVYYRYLLWSDDAFNTIQARKGSAREPERLLDDVVIDWLPPSGEVPFADLSNLGDVLDHENYPSDDESDLEDTEQRFNGDKEGDKSADSTDKTRLTPLQIAKFSWILSSMPRSHTQLCKGHVAAVTSFAMRHARIGAEAIVNMLVLNIEKPYVDTSSARYNRKEPTQDENDDYEPDQELPSIESAPTTEAPGDKGEPDDPSLVKLVGLYLINDILRSSATAGAKNAWKYRTLFETAFKQRKTFQYLGKLEKELGWGRMRAQNWRNRIKALFDIWEQGNVFALDSFDTLKKDFAEQAGQDNPDSGLLEGAKKPEEKWMVRFKRVGDVSASPAGSASPAPLSSSARPQSLAADDEDLDGTPMDDLDGVPMEDLDGVPMDEDLDGVPMDDEDLDGVPMDDDLDGVPMDEDLDGVPMEDAPTTAAPIASEPSTMETKGMGFSVKGSSVPKPATPEAPKRRKLAEDMFADSDEE